VADAQITDGQMLAMVNAGFQTQLTRRIVSMWRNMLRIVPASIASAVSDGAAEGLLVSVGDERGGNDGCGGIIGQASDQSILERE
jgi:hypothetical protein